MELNDIQKKLHRKKVKEAESKFDEGNTSIHNVIADYLISIYKDTDLIIEEHDSFFKTLKCVKQL